MKIMVVCGHGLGTSLMMEMSIKSIVKELNVDAAVDHIDLGSAKAQVATFSSAQKTLQNSWKHSGVEQRIVALDNMVDKVAMKERLSLALQELGAL